jgi:hypothetical protein
MRLIHHRDTRPPRIEVHSHDGARQIASFSYAQIDQLIREGRLSVADLFTDSPQAEHQLCRQLALHACAQACRHGMACLALDCPLHPLQTASASARLGAQLGKNVRNAPFERITR